MVHTCSPLACTIEHIMCPYVLQCREQLQALGGLRGELAALQAALTQQKLHQQQHKVQEARAEADRHQEVSSAPAGRQYVHRCGWAWHARLHAPQCRMCRSAAPQLAKLCLLQAVAGVLLL
jgi:hypothetical protein